MSFHKPASSRAINVTQTGSCTEISNQERQGTIYIRRRSKNVTELNNSLKLWPAEWCIVLTRLRHTRDTRQLVPLFFTFSRVLPWVRFTKPKIRWQSNKWKTTEKRSNTVPRSTSAQTHTPRSNEIRRNRRSSWLLYRFPGMYQQTTPDTRWVYSA